jgi:hypothetical protein
MNGQTSDCCLLPTCDVSTDESVDDRVEDQRQWKWNSCCWYTHYTDPWFQMHPVSIGRGCNPLVLLLLPLYLGNYQ